MIHYILQVALFQVLFLAIYDLFLKKETFFVWNRIYLISSSVLAYIIPFIKIASITTYANANITPNISKLLLAPQNILLDTVVIGKEPIAKINYLSLETIYGIGFIIAICLFLYKLKQLVDTINQHKVIVNKQYKLVVLPKQNKAFSFFNFLFMGKSLLQKEHQHIIEHELVHIKQHHSLDLLFFEIQKVLFWFNPLTYLYQHKISALHEFIADAKTIEQENKISFFNTLLAQNFQVENFSFINNYYKKSLLKKRIIMASKNKSAAILKLKYVLILPLLLSMLIYTSCEKETSTEVTQLIEYKNLDNKPTLVDSKKESVKDKEREFMSAIFKVSFENLINATENGYYPIHFTINTNGAIEHVDYTEVPKQYLTNAQKIIEQLPEMNPGKMKTKSVATKMTILLTTRSNEVVETEILPFAIIDEVPVYKGCENSKEKKKCMATAISQLVAKEFNTDLANDLNLSSGSKRISIQFEIDKKGTVTNVKARAPHPKLKEEAIRIINLIPKMKAGKQAGKAVSVRYNLPIRFNVTD